MRTTDLHLGPDTTDDDAPCPCGASHTRGEHGYNPDAEAAGAIIDDHRSGHHRLERHGGCPLCDTAEQADADRQQAAADHDAAKAGVLEATDRCPECGQDFRGRYCEACALVSTAVDLVHELIGDDDSASDRLDALASLLATVSAKPELAERIALDSGMLAP